jgi:hypothetical protein
MLTRDMIGTMLPVLFTFESILTICTIIKRLIYPFSQIEKRIKKLLSRSSTI